MKPNLQRRHFELIAETIRSIEVNVSGVSRQVLIRTLAERFADRLKGTNQYFDREKFIRACGVYE